MDISELDKNSSASSSLFRASNLARPWSSKLDTRLDISLSNGSLWRVPTGIVMICISFSLIYLWAWADSHCRGLKGLLVVVAREIVFDFLWLFLDRLVPYSCWHFVLWAGRNFGGFKCILHTFLWLYGLWTHSFHIVLGFFVVTWPWYFLLYGLSCYLCDYILFHILNIDIILYAWYVESLYDV